MEKSTFAKRIKELRTKVNMTQCELAEMLNASKTSVSNYENGISLPDIEKLHLMASKFGVSFDYLLGRIDEEGKPTGRKIFENDDSTDYAATFMMPFIDNISMCGLADVLASAGYVPVPEGMVPDGRLFAVRADVAYEDFGIECGDVVIIHAQDCAEAGEVALVRADGKPVFVRIAEANEEVIGVVVG